jgi:alanine dehydrogenase
MPTVLILSNEDIARMLTMRDCMNVLREMYCDLAEDKTLIMPRVDNITPTNHAEAYYAFKHMGGAWLRHHILALRLNSDVITNPTIGGSARRVKIPRANGRWVGLVQLFSIETGELLAIFPDGVAQRMRVGATSGLGIEYLARKEARRAGMIGSGWQAGAQLMAILAARPSIEQVKVYSTRKENRESFVEQARKDYTNIDIRPVDSAEECARDVDILLSATSSLTPIIQSDWLKPGMHIGCIKVQEVNQAILDRCDRVSVHNKLQINQTDNILPGTAYLPAEDRQGWWNPTATGSKNYAGLPEMIVGNKTGRIDDQAITCFVNNTGLGLQFAALGTIILAQARQQGIGTELPTDWFNETVHP